MATNLTQLKWSTDRKITRLFLSSFCHNFDLRLSSFFRSAVIFRRASEKLLDFLFSDWFFICHSLLFFVVFSNASRYSSRMKFCRIWFRFCPLRSTINSQLLWDVLSRGKEIINLLFSYQFYSSWVLFVNIFWYFDPSFIQLEINDVLKPDLMSVVTEHMVRSLWNIPPKSLTATLDENETLDTSVSSLPSKADSK